MSTSTLALKQKAVEWLKLNRDKIIEEQTHILFEVLRANGKPVPAHRRRHIITILIHSLISRMEGKSTQTETIQEIAEQMISVGVNLPCMVVIIDSLRNIVVWRANHDLTMSADLNRYLTEKVDYFSQLAKANAAAVMVQAQGQQYLGRVPLPNPVQSIDLPLPNRVVL